MSSTQEIERRAWPVERLEVRAEGDGPPVIVGYAAVFNELSLDLGGFRERVAQGAFTQSLADNDVRALWEHNPQYVLGRNRAGTLSLEEDERGLAIEATPPATRWAADLLASMKRGDVTGMSFGFYVRQDEWIEEDGVLVRVLRDVDLFDVSVVTFPAYTQTSAEARATADRRRQTAGGQGGGGAGEKEERQQPGPAEDEGERARRRARRAARQREIEILSEV